MRPRDSTRVEITVEGHLDPRWESEFYGMELVYKSDGTTVIRGPVTDQAALHGLLRRVRDARMTLLAVKHTSKEQKIGRNKMSNIIVFGATGRSGSAVIKQALKAGYSVTAFVRDPGKMETSNPKLRVVSGDVLDPASVERAVAGQDAVVSCLGAGLKGRVRSEGTRNIIRAMERAGVSRLISQSSLGVGDSRANLNFFWKRIMFGLLLRKAYADHGVQEKYIRESRLDWTIVRPASLTEEEATGDYLHGFSPKERNLSLKIALGDLADFVIHELENGSYQRQAPGLSYAEAR